MKKRIALALTLTCLTSALQPTKSYAGVGATVGSQTMVYAATAVLATFGTWIVGANLAESDNPVVSAAGVGMVAVSAPALGAAAALGGGGMIAGGGVLALSLLGAPIALDGTSEKGDGFPVLSDDLRVQSGLTVDEASAYNQYRDEANSIMETIAGEDLATPQEKASSWIQYTNSKIPADALGAITKYSRWVVSQAQFQK